MKAAWRQRAERAEARIKELEAERQGFIKSEAWLYDRWAALDGIVDRVAVVAGEMVTRMRAYKPRAGPRVELEEWFQAIWAAFDGGEVWETVFRPRAVLSTDEESE
jgi:hypothetical protein